MTAFFFGYLLGLLTPLAVAGLAFWWIARCASKEAIAKFLHGMALVLNYKPKPPVASVNGKPMKESST
jgi:hypothetical protein